MVRGSKLIESTTTILLLHRHQKPTHDHHQTIITNDININIDIDIAKTKHDILINDLNQRPYP